MLPEISSVPAKKESRMMGNGQVLFSFLEIRMSKTSKA